MSRKLKYKTTVLNNQQKVKIIIITVSVYWRAFVFIYFMQLLSSFKVQLFLLYNY